MKKTILFYVLTVFTIAVLSVLANIQLDMFSLVSFSPKLHIIMEILISVVIIMIFASSNKFYSQTKDEKFLILGYGFLVSVIFELIHAFTVNSFPYDNLSLANIEKNPTSIYLFMGNMLLPLSIYASLIYKQTLTIKGINFKLNIIKLYSYIFVLLAIFPVIIYYFFPLLLKHFYVFVHALEYISYSLYLMLAAILISSNFEDNKPDFNKFTSGLVVLGFSGLLYINPLLLPINGILAHGLQFLGLLMVLFGLGELSSISASLRIKDELVAYLSLLLIAFYIAFVTITSSMFNVVFPQSSGFIFIEFLLLFQLVIYVFTVLSWDKIANVYSSAEKDRSLVRVFESMRRVSSPSIIKNIVVDEIIKAYEPDKCFLVKYNPEDKTFNYDNYSEFLPSKTLIDSSDLDSEAAEVKKFQEVFKNIEICFSDVEEYIAKCSLAGTPQGNLLKDLKIKSLYSIPINYKGNLQGYIILQYTNDYKELKENDFSFLDKMASQIGVAINK